MASAADLRAEAQRIRDFALTVTDPDVLDQIQAMILELERRARELGNDDALGSMYKHATNDISPYSARRQTLQRRDDHLHG